jgi:uncharacterized protein (TIGR00369 family)
MSLRGTTEHKVLDPNFKEKIKEKLTRQFFMKLVGLNLTKIEVGYVEAELNLEEKHLQQNYFLHGGVTSTACDLVMGFAAYSLCPAELGVVTADLNISFLKPGIGSKLRAEGRVIKPGASLYFCEADLFVLNSKNEWVHIAKSTSTMHTIKL